MKPIFFFSFPLSISLEKNRFGSERFFQTVNRSYFFLTSGECYVYISAGPWIRQLQKKNAKARYSMTHRKRIVAESFLKFSLLAKKTNKSSVS